VLDTTSVTEPFHGRFSLAILTRSYQNVCSKYRYDQGLRYIFDLSPPSLRYFRYHASDKMGSGLLKESYGKEFVTSCDFKHTQLHATLININLKVGVHVSNGDDLRPTLL